MKTKQATKTKTTARKAANPNPSAAEVRQAHSDIDEAVEILVRAANALLGMKRGDPAEMCQYRERSGALLGEVLSHVEELLIELGEDPDTFPIERSERANAKKGTAR